MQESKVIFHIDEMDNWNMLVKDVIILLEALKEYEEFDIEVLATAEAVKFYNNNNEVLNELIRDMTFLKDSGVKFVVCKKSLDSFNLNENDLVEFVEIVPVGTLELINKQGEQYIYLKAW